MNLCVCNLFEVDVYNLQSGFETWLPKHSLKSRISVLLQLGPPRHEFVTC